MARKKKSLRDTELSVKIEALTLEMFLDHYVQLRFYYWNGSLRTQSGDKYFVFESLPNFTEVKATSKKTYKFKTEEEALAFMSEIRNKTKETLLNSLHEALDGNSTEAGESTGSV